MLLFNATIYHVWWERNQRRFGDSNRTLKGVTNDIYFDVLNRSKKRKPLIHEIHVVSPMLAEWGMDTSSSITHPRTCA